VAPSADTTVVARLLEQGFSARPGRHSRRWPETRW
jgi:hypothetical protein